MSMTRSDLPHLAAMSPENQTAMVGALWRAWRKAEPGDLEAQAAGVTIPTSRVASCAEMVEAVLAQLEALPG